MKKLFSILLICCMMLSLTACNKSNSDGNDASSTDKAEGDSKVTDSKEATDGGSLDVWMISQGTKTDAYAEAFADAYPEIDFSITWYSDDDLKTQSKIALDSGVVPDVFAGHAGTDFQDYYNSGLLLDITSLLKDSQTYDRISEGYYGPYTVEDKIYGYPIAGLTTWQTLYINRDILKECGITEDPKTVSDLIELSSKISEKGYAPIAIGNLDEWPAVILFGDYYAQLEKDMSVTNNIMEGTDTFTNNQSIRTAFQTVVDLGQAGAFMPGFASTDQNTAIQTFAAGQAAMLYCGSWWSGIAGGTDLGFDLDVIQLPLIDGLTDNASVQLCSDVALLATKDCNKDALTKFIDYLTDGGYYKTYAEELSAFTISSDTSINDNLNLDKVFTKEPIMRQFEKPVLSPFFDWVFPAPVTTKLKSAFQEAIAGNISVDDALAQVQAIMDKNPVK